MNCDHDRPAVECQRKQDQGTNTEAQQTIWFAVHDDLLTTVVDFIEPNKPAVAKVPSTRHLKEKPHQ